jgi:hypothetical protein
MLGETIVPPHEGAGGVYALQCLFAWDPQLLILCGSVGEQNCIVVGFQGGKREIIAEVDVSDEVETRRGGYLCEFILAVLSNHQSGSIYPI